MAFGINGFEDSSQQKKKEKKNLFILQKLESYKNNYELQEQFIHCFFAARHLELNDAKRNKILIICIMF